ncbi:MAG TPA: hypothetical protein VK843_04725 [Planctomycetota bacterium]|nr:hypothetical protein [Planctomycetota bacterium]
MIAAAEQGLAGVCAGIVLPAEDNNFGALIKFGVLLVIFIGPAILKAIQESARKKRELAERAGSQSATLEPRSEAVEAVDEDEPEAQPAGELAPSGREQWERLMRGESASPPPVLPPPIPIATPRRPQRRILTDTRALTEEEALTETPAMTDVRPVITAMPETSLEDPTGYDGTHIPKGRVGTEFAEFAPQEGLASDREGGPTKRIGGRATFGGSDAFQNLSERGAQSEVSKREIGGQGFDVSEGQPRSFARKRMTRAQLRRSMQLAEILGPPVGSRPFESGPTRPLGWS